MRKITKWAEIKRIALAVIVVVGMTSAVVAGPSNLQKVFNEAKAAYNAQNYEKAAVGFRQVLKYQPGYIYARKYLTLTEQKIREGGKVPVSLESKLAQLKIPSVEFAETNLGAVLTYLSQKSGEVSGGKVVANFIYKGPADDKQTKTVTLRLSNVPLTEVIRYVGQLTGTKFKYEEFAVVGIPGATVLREVAGLKGTQGQKGAEQGKLKFDDPPKGPVAK